MKTLRLSKISVVFFILTRILFAQNYVNFVTYGPQSNTREGDNDFFQIFYIEVDSSHQSPFGLEIFDPDCGGEIDKNYGEKFNSQFEFTLFGGSEVLKYFKEDDQVIEESSSNNLYVIEKLISSELNNYDNKWLPLSVDMNLGAELNGKKIFALMVKGLKGNDANVFNIRVANNDKFVRILNYSSTLHVLPNSNPIQILFNSKNNRSLTISSFDADFKKIDFASDFRKIRLKSSGDDNWIDNSINLLNLEINNRVAIQFSGISKKSNDVVFQIRDDMGKLIPQILPVIQFQEEKKISYDYKIKQIDCNKLQLKLITDSKINKNLIRWIDQDKNEIYGANQVIEFAEQGLHKIILAVESEGDILGRGWHKIIEANINMTPMANVGDDIYTSPNKRVKLSGKNSSDKDGSISNYNWNFGDGKIGHGIELYHVYSKPGKYKVKLNVTDNSNSICNSSVDSLFVFVNDSPIAKFNLKKRYSVNEDIIFDASKSIDKDGRIISYYWEFGDGNSSNEMISNHHYRRPGKYKVKLVVKDNSGQENDKSILEKIIIINSPPIIKTKTSYEVAINEQFKLDASSSSDIDGKIIKYYWFKNKSRIDSGSTIKLSFSDSGDFKVILKVKDDSRTISEFSSTLINIRVNHPPISIAGKDIKQTERVIKYDGGLSKDPDGKIIAYNWDFGDGIISNKINGKHYYNEPGKYKVILTTTDNSSAKNNKSHDTINVDINSLPIADAGADRRVAPNEKILFSSLNSIDIDGDISRVEWYLGNKLISNEENFNWQFSKPGLYNILLIVWDNSGDELATSTDEVLVRVNKPPIIIVDKFIKVSPNQTFRLDASKSYDEDGSISSYSWYSENNIIGSESICEYKFSESGNYKIILRVKDNDELENSISETKINIQVNHPPEIVTNSLIKSCSNQIDFAANASFDPDGDKISYNWDFGDGNYSTLVNPRHIYKEAGKYPVVLKLNDNSGLANSISNKEINVLINSRPTVNIGEDEVICVNDFYFYDATESFDSDGDNLSYHWNFGDSTFSTEEVGLKKYKSPGVYKVILKINDDSGLNCSENYKSKTITVLSAPVANAGDDIIGQVFNPIKFNGRLSNGNGSPLYKYHWDFGDGNEESGMEVIHSYHSSGKYTVKLTVTGKSENDCGNSSTDELIAIINDAPKAFFESVDSVAVNEEIRFNNLSSSKLNDNLSFEWDFGDGTVSTERNPIHSFSLYGKYKVRLRVKLNSDKASTSLFEKDLIVNSTPIAKARIDTTCYVNDPVKFSAFESSDIDGEITKYFWNFGDGKTGEGIFTSHTYTKSANYKVKLVVRDNTNLSNSENFIYKDIDIIKTPEFKLISPTKILVGDKYSFKIEDGQNSKTDSIKWFIGREFIEKSDILNYIFNKKGYYNLKALVYYNNDQQIECYDKIYVGSAPNFSIKYDSLIYLNTVVNFSLFYDENSQDNFLSEWKLGDNIIHKGNNVSGKFTKLGLQNCYLTVVDAKNSSVYKKEFKVKVINRPHLETNVKKSYLLHNIEELIKFDASLSFSEDKRPLSFLWNFGDGATSGSMINYHKFKNFGKYQITISVFDPDYPNKSKITQKHWIEIKKKD